MLKWVIRFEEQKLAPEDGGGLSQALSFLDSLDFFTAEMNFWRAKLGIHNG